MATVTVIPSDITKLKNDVSTIKQDVATIPGDITKLKSDVSTLKQDVAGKASTADVDNKLKLYLNKMIYRPSWVAEGMVAIFTP